MNTIINLQVSIQCRKFFTIYGVTGFTRIVLMETVTLSEYLDVKMKYLRSRENDVELWCWYHSPGIREIK
jgi:hypothetical protein